MRSLIKIPLITLAFLWISYGAYTITDVDQKLIDLANAKIDQIIETSPEKEEVLRDKIGAIKSWNFSERITTVFGILFDRWENKSNSLAKEWTWWMIFETEPSYEARNKIPKWISWIMIEDTEEYTVSKEGEQHRGNMLVKISQSHGRIGSECSKTSEFIGITSLNETLTLQKYIALNPKYDSTYNCTLEWYISTFQFIAPAWTELIYIDEEKQSDLTDIKELVIILD